MPGRIARGQTDHGGGGSNGVDDTGLWHYIDASSPSAACCDGVSDTTEMASCIADWRAGNYNNPLFTLAIADAVRFGAVPVLDAGAWGNGTSTYGIADIVPVISGAAIAPAVTEMEMGTGTVEDQDRAVPSSTIPPTPRLLGSGQHGERSNRLNAVTAFVLDVEMLPEPLRSNFPTSPEQVDYALTK